jgi:3-dehydroquinate synthase
MPQVRVRHALGSYPVIVAPGALGELAGTVRRLWPDRRVAIITDETVQRMLGDRLAGGPWHPMLAIPPGEESKTRDGWLELTDALLAAGFSRDSALVAIGGGVVGDLAGFVAATLARGIPYLQVPTTLLAMVDSSVGGKTGVDTPHGKNLVGAFHPPEAVLADPTVLKTLPSEVFRGGLAEMVKHALVADREYWTRLESGVPVLLARDPAALTPLIVRSIEIKAEVVAQDERETGLRSILNAGHTVAHAVELLTGFQVPHGDAVAIGLVAESRIAEKVGVAESGLAERLRLLLASLDLPVTIPPTLDAPSLIEAMASDKKRRGGRLRFALPQTIGAMARDGSAWTIAVPDGPAIQNALRECGAG